MTDTSDTLSRPEWACLLCAPPRKVGAWRPADSGYRTCSGCLDRLRERLHEVVRRYMMLNPQPGSSGEHGGRGAPGFGSRSPASEHVISMRDRRSSATAKTWRGRDNRLHMEQENPPLSVHNVLDEICWDIAEQRGIDGPPATADVPELGRWIDRHLDWVTRNLIVVDVDRAVRGILAQLRPVTGEPGRKQVGACPNPIATETEPRQCGQRLYAPLRGDSIICANPDCLREWPREEWLRLGAMLQDAS